MGSYKYGLQCPLIWVITMVTLLITPLIPTHVPPSKIELNLDVKGLLKGNYRWGV